MKKTLEDIQQNLEDSKNGTSSDDSSDDDAVDEGEDITQNVDSGALGDDVKQTSTEDANLAKDTGADTNQTENTDSYDNSEPTIFRMPAKTAPLRTELQKRHRMKAKTEQQTVPQKKSHRPQVTEQMNPQIIRRML